MTTTHAPRTVTPSTLDELVGSSDVPVLVDLWAEWCGPCHALARSLGELAAERGSSLAVVSLDTDAHPDAARRFEVLSVPTILLFRDGELIGRLVGARPKDRIAAEIDRMLG
jgi:thioredoxin 1